MRRCQHNHLSTRLLLFCAPALFVVVRAAQTVTPPVQIQHPLDPLTAAEIETAAKVLTAAPQFPAEAQFATIVLKEPPKSDVLSYTPGTPIARQAFAVILDRKRNRAFEAVVDVKAPRVVSWNEVKGVQPVVLEHEYDVLVDIVKKDPRWQAAMRKRGINDFDKVQIDNWAVGQVAPQYQKRRLLRALSYFKGESTNFYGRPIEGVVALVDMNTEKVVEFIDTGVVPLPPPSQELDEKSTGTRAAPETAQNHAARGRELRDSRPGDSLAEMALPLHDAPARRPGAAHNPL